MKVLRHLRPVPGEEGARRGDPGHHPRPGSPRFRVPLPLLAVLGVVAVLAAWCLVRYPDANLQYWGIVNMVTDLHVYRWGGEHVAAHLPLYDGLLSSLDPGQAYRGPMAWTYTPFAAAAFVVLVPLSLQLMEAVWLGGILLSTFIVCRTMLSWLGYRAEPRTTWAAVFLAGGALFLEPVRTTLWLGQINLLLLALVLLDASSRARWRGVLTGIAAGVKLTPGFLWAHFLVTRQFRTLAVSIASFLGTIVLGAIAAPADSLHYWTGGLLDAGRIGIVAAPSNQSLNGALAWYVFDGVTPVWAWLLGGVACGILGLVVAHRVHTAGHPQLALVLSGMTGCVVSPFSWGHHWVWMVPLFVVLLHYLVRYARRGLAALCWALPPILYFFVGAWIFRFPDPDQPANVWIGTGWFMSRQALSGVLGPILREPYLVVWVVSLVLALVLTSLVRSPSAARATEVAVEEN